MIETLLLILVIANIALSLFLFLKVSSNSSGNSDAKFTNLENNQLRLEKILSDEFSRSRETLTQNERQARTEISQSLKNLSDSLLSRIEGVAGLQKNQLDLVVKQLENVTQTNEQRLERMRVTVEEKLRFLQEENVKKLDEMRATVDEKLHSTLEKRLGESFKLVSDRLELVHRGLGEMQSLAAGVSDLKKVLTNVKTRGMMGEIQLGNLLEQLLTPEQYAVNIATKKGSNDRVEFAIRLPGRDGRDGTQIWLPLDAKFPLEDYRRLIEAYERANAVEAEEAGRLLEIRIKEEARDIRDKYLDPPYTTDFGIMFLPIEGLYAEVLRRPGLCDLLQREFRVVISGPTTLAALLNSLQMGFRTLAIEKRSSEVWQLLGAVKAEFGKFGDILDKTQKKLQEASNSIESAAKKSRFIETKLKNVQVLPSSEVVKMLDSVEDFPEADEPESKN